MTRREFFNQIFGPTGKICIRGLFYDRARGAAKQVICETLDEADSIIAAYEEEGREVYFTTGAIKPTSTKASISDILYHRSFFIDIDCGENKPYASKKEGLTALVKFCEATTLPMPTLIDSGNGVHGYWFLGEEVMYDLWKPVGMGLKDKTRQLGFEIDDGVTGEGARILRVPDTFNKKNPDKHKPVSVKSVGATISFAEFSEIIPAVATHATSKGYQPDELTRSLMGEYPTYKFDIILKKSLRVKEHEERVKVVIQDKEGNDTYEYRKRIVERCAGCPQIKQAYETRSVAKEEFWRSALSVAKFCTDSEQAIQIISEGHPEYSPENTIEKAELIVGPHRCETFQRVNPDGCKDCIHKGLISGPLLLGKYTEYAAPSDNIIDDVIHDGFFENVTVEVPMFYPGSWARPKTGGIVKRHFEDADQADELDKDMETFVYENDLWVKQLLNDPGHGETAHIVHIKPHGPNMKRVIEFTMPLTDVGKKDVCQRILTFHGVHRAVLPATLTLLQAYIQSWVAKLEHEQIGGPYMAREHYGWHKESFVYGSKEYTFDKPPVYSPPSKNTEDSAPAFTAKGSLDLWKDMANLYNAPGNEARAFILFIGFGAPLFSFLNLGSVLVHLTNKDSGVGKSTAQKVAASIWGDPKELVLLSTDTDNARYQQFGVFRHLPVFVDEITNMPHDKLSEFAFRVSQNRGKHRQNSHNNSLRKNTTKWETIVVTSGNNSLYDTLRQHKVSVDGELNRIIELPLAMKDNLSIEEASRWYEQVLPNNYGVAGEIYAQYITDQKEQLMKEVIELSETYVKKFNFAGKHRFYRGCCAAAFTGARVAQRLGLHDIDIDRVERWAIGALGGIQAAVQEASAQDSVAVLGQFLNAYKRNELVVGNNGVFMQAGLEIPQAASKEPLGQLVVRVENSKDKHLMYISKSVLANWCGEQRVPVAVMLDDLEKRGVLVSKSMYKRLAEGTSSPGLPVAVICLDLDATTKEKLDY